MLNKHRRHGAMYKLTTVVDIEEVWLNRRFVVCNTSVRHILKF